MSYTDDEVQQFHPLFEAAANKALVNLGLSREFQWIHHHRTPGNSLIPDFVLVRQDTGRWILAMEIKRTPASVHSTRNQIQAQGYAATNSNLYPANAPQFFAISNLEQTILFAQREGLPPRECQVHGGIYNVGSFSELKEDDFHAALVNKLEAVVSRVSTGTAPEFDEVWSQILSRFIHTAGALAGSPKIEEPCTPFWNDVRDYFCHSLDLDSSRILVLRCLLAEYIHGVLERFGHPNIRRLVPLTRSVPGRVGRTIANALSRLRDVDFRSVFEDESVAIYRNLDSEITLDILSEYIQSITTPPSIVRELARDRLDRNEFLDGVVYAIHQGESLDDRGKVLTDPELAEFLAAVTVTSPDEIVLDPCCGDGILLEAAYTRLRRMGLDHTNAVQNLRGIEVDPTLFRLAFLRITLQEPANVKPEVEPNIVQGDMFESSEIITTANVVLMNPPFRRYENQDPYPFPDQIKTHYLTSIRSHKGQNSIAEAGQQNIFTYYVEYLVSTLQQGCRMGIILDNKWYHNKYAAPLRKLISEECAIEALIEYPYVNLFSNWLISTSILVCRKEDKIPENHVTKFIRCSLDLGQIDPMVARQLIDGEGKVPTGWSCREIPQRELGFKYGWKSHFSDALTHNYQDNLPKLHDLFEWGRRGSLAKEEGGMSAIAFPFSSRKFGNVREADPRARRRYQNRIVRQLTRAENNEIYQLAQRIVDAYRGYAINHSWVPDSYILTEEQLLREPVIEPPVLVGHPAFWSKRKVPWGEIHDIAVEMLEADEATHTFLSTFRRITGLNHELMPNEWFFVGLKEPYAGELIIPRKLRKGHRVHVNPYACSDGNRQVRLSSNFISFCQCIATDEGNGLDRLEAVKLIAAFLTSSFGQLQFETKGYNREGCNSVELHHLEQVHVVDPRTLSRADRERILIAFEALPYPVSANLLSADLLERNALDEVWATVLCRQNGEWRKHLLLSEVHSALDEYLLAREP